MEKSESGPAKRSKTKAWENHRVTVKEKPRRKVKRKTKIMILVGIGGVIMVIIFFFPHLIERFETMLGLFYYSHHIRTVWLSPE